MDNSAHNHAVSGAGSHRTGKPASPVLGPRAHLKVGIAAAAGAAMMLGAAYAAVPIYKLICEATGLGGTTRRADKAPGAIGEARLRVRFNATVSSGLPWQFMPVENVMDVRIGEAVLAHYQAVNRSVRTTTGTATFNVTPEIVGKYFSKIECFCFTEQVLTGGQKADMPVTFFIDPAILQDGDAAGVEEITLSYTFFAAPGARGNVAVKTGPSAPAGQGASGSRSIE